MVIFTAATSGVQIILINGLAFNKKGWIIEDLTELIDYFLILQTVYKITKITTCVESLSRHLYIVEQAFKTLVLHLNIRFIFIYVIYNLNHFM